MHTIVTNADLVRIWMQKAGQATPDEPTPMDADTVRLRQRLVYEEALETHKAFDAYRRDREDPETAAELVKELADVLVVVYGTFAAMGIDADTAFSEVMANNDRKLKYRLLDEGGKVVVEPAIKEELKRAIHERLVEMLV